MVAKSQQVEDLSYLPMVEVGGWSEMSAILPVGAKTVLEKAVAALLWAQVGVSVRTPKEVGTPRAMTAAMALSPVSGSGSLSSVGMICIIDKVSA